MPAHMKLPYKDMSVYQEGQIMHSSGRYEQVNVDITWQRELHTVLQQDLYGTGYLSTES